MSELQPEIDIDEQDVQPEVEQDVKQSQPEDPDKGSASATDDTAKEQAVEFTPEQQERFNREIGKKVAKLREIERANQKLMREAEELRQKLPKETRPEVPDVPDPYALTDEQFKAQIKQREEVLRQQAQWDARQQYIQQQQQAKQQEIEQQRIDAINAEADKYRQRALKVGVKEAELQAAGAAVYSAFGDNNPLSEMILKDEQGPLITLYLGNNPLELESLTDMSPLEGAVKLVTEIRQKAAALKRKVNETPDPIDAPRQSGAGQKSYGVEGATFE